MLSDEVATTSVPTSAVTPLMGSTSGSAESIFELLWRGGFRLTGSLRQVVNGLPTSVTTLGAARLFAVTDHEDPELLNTLLGVAAPVPQAQAPETYATARYAIGRPETMRWITANAHLVASSENWCSLLPGLGGVTSSVPLADEALTAVLQTKADLPRELGTFVQLNPWFSRRFARRCRRRLRAKRIRMPERAATARAWSHARTVLMPQLPPPWQSLLKRGEGRPLDDWSLRLVTRYVRICNGVFKGEVVPPVLTSLYVIAAAAAGAGGTSADPGLAWSALPIEVEDRGRRLMGSLKPPGELIDPRLDDIAGLAKAAAQLGDDEEAWRRFAGVALVDNHGISGAAARLN